jgi:hypothetical protein
VSVIPWLGFVCGLVLLLVTGASVVKTFLIPRKTVSRFNAVVSGTVRRTFRMLTARIEDLARREQVLSASGPTFLLSLLASWIICLLFGYALLFWPLSGHGFPSALRESGSSLFTLGFSPPSGAGPAVVVFVAAASGLAVVALLIAYLPVLYAAFNRRETLVNMLEALAGSPPWGPELLARQALIDNVGYLPRLYERWTEWAADISESHVNYRTLIYFRSPDPAASWLLSLLAVLDGAALHLALNPSSAPSEARPLMRVGYLALRRLAGALNLPVAADPTPDDPLTLTRQEFDHAVQRLRDAGWTVERSTEDAWAHFRGWRVNYEAAAYQLANHLDLPPALWSGPRRPGRPAAAPPWRPSDRRPQYARPLDGRPASEHARPGHRPGDEPADRELPPGQAGRPSSR